MRQWIAGEGKDIELRHQRNPDVLFDSVRQEEGTVMPTFIPPLQNLPYTDIRIVHDSPLREDCACRTSSGGARGGLLCN